MNEMVYVVQDTYEQTPRAFKLESSARKHLAGIINEYREGGWRVYCTTKGREYELSSCEGHYNIFCDCVEVE